MVRTNEGGSILSFVVVGAILTVLLIGSVYAVRQHFVGGQQPPAAEKTSEPVVTDQKPSDEGQSSPDGSQVVTEPVTNDQVVTDAAPSAGTSGTNSSTELPQTGPVSMLMSVLAVGLLTSSAIAYVRSRRYQLPTASI